MKLIELEQELQHVYGKSEGSRVFRKIIPGILADFIKMYKKAPAGSLVRETYRFEDRKGSIMLKAVKNGREARIDAEFTSSVF